MRVFEVGRAGALRRQAPAQGCARARRRGSVCLGVRIEGEELLFCSSRDVTERRAQARELERYRASPRDAGGRARRAVARLGGALPRARRAVAGRRCTWQLNNEYRFVNEAFAAIFGYARAQDMLDGRARAHA